MPSGDMPNSVQQEVRRTGWRECAGHTEALHGHRCVVHHHLGHRAAESAEDGVLLARQDGAGVEGGGDDPVFVDRADRGQVEDAGRDASSSQELGSGHRTMGERAVGDDRQVAAVAQHVGLARLERVAFGEEIRHPDPAEPQEDGAFEGGHPLGGGGGFDSVRRRHHCDVRDGADPGEILRGVVRRSQLSVGHARADAAKLHVRVGVGDIRLDLLQSPACQEAGCRTHEGESCRHLRGRPRRRP